MNKNFTLSGFSDEISPFIYEQFKHLKSLGISYFEPRGINEKNISELTLNEATSLKNTMDKYGIRASSIGSPIGKININDDFDEHIKKLQHVIEITKTLETKYIRVFSFYMPKDDNPEKYKQEVLSRMKIMVNIAEKSNIVLLHENEKCIYGDTAVRCANLFEEISSPYFRAVFDPANFIQCNEDTLNAFNILKPYIEYVHIKDAKPDGSVVPAGMGSGNIFEILKQLEQSGFKGFLSLEPHLGYFTGLSSLEQGDEMLKLKKSGPEKFTLANRHLINILGRIENGE